MAAIYPMIQQIAKRQLSKQNYFNANETTDIVHDAFLKLKQQHSIHWKNRNQFLAISTQIIKRILIDDYRAKASNKRGQMQANITLDKLASQITGDIDIDFNLIEFDGLLKKLTQLDPTAAQIVELRFYSGLTQKEAAEAMDLSLSETVSNWKFARSWLLNQLVN